MEPNTVVATAAPDLASIARDLRAKVLAGQDLTKEEAMEACKFIRAGRRAAAELKGKTTKSSAPPRSATDLMAAFGLKPKT